MKNVILVIFTFCLLAGLSFAVDRNVGAGQTYATIQNAIDAATSGDVINVYPGTYDQDEANGWDLITGGVGSSNFNIFVNKSLTIQGVTAGGVAITDYSSVLAFVIAKRNTPLSNLSTFFIQADNVTISGLDITAYLDPAYNFKTISIIGENTTIKDCELHNLDQVSSIYMYDPRYNPGTDVSYVTSYRFEGNFLDAGGIYASGIRFSSGAGWTGNVANRIIMGNTITGGSYGIEFVGPQADPWDLYPVGAATITNNSFTGQDKGSLVAWGEYSASVGYGSLDWDGIWTNNNFDKAVIVKTSGGEVRYYDILPQFKYIRGIYCAIQRYPVNNVAQAGDIINVAAGTYAEVGQIVIDKDLTIIGEDKATTIINPTDNTGSTDDARGWWLVNAGVLLNLSNVTLDGAGFDIYQCVRSSGGGIYDNVTFKNIIYPGYSGVGLAVFGLNNVTITNCDFTNMGRIGALLFGAGLTNSFFTNNTYTGKGNGDWLDYAADISAGAIITVDNCNISNNKGIASSDGSTSAGILVSTYYGAGTEATITNSTLSDNTTGIAVGYDASDASAVVAHYNNILNNTSFGISSTNPPVNAENNWWGTAVETEIQAMIDGPIDYDPWIGKAEMVNVTQLTPTIYDFPTAGVKMEFTTLPSGGGNVTVSRYNEAPTPFPSGYENVGMWLDISSTMPNYSFDVEITVDVTGLGFDDTQSVMYFNSTTSTWVAVAGGVYNAGLPETFTFSTNHFTPFTFINEPEDAFNVYLSSSTAASAGVIYPNTDWGVTPYEGLDEDDWDFTSPISLYIVPEVGSVFGASDITIQWDNTMFSYDGVDKTGGIYDNASSQFFPNQVGNQLTINASRTDNANFTIGAGQYIAMINFDLLKPGFGLVNFTALDFRAFDGVGGQLGVYMTGNNAEVKSYLGDVASSTSTATGDGLVDFDDVSPWAISYWSGVGGTGMANYKVKYDVGPTSDHSVYGLPTTDAKIQFEDLVIFAMSYGLSASNVYPKIEAEPTEPVELQLAEPIVNGNQTRIPLYVSGGVQNVRAMSLTLTNQFGKLVSVEKGSLLSEFENPVMLMHNSDGKQVYVDLAVFGAEETGINSEGEVLILVFEGTTELDLNSADIRNIFNKPMEVNISGTEGLVPAEFALLQNYPNPFNPSTTINYALPTQTMVEISIFNVLGEKVATLVNEMKEAGKHTAEFNAVGYSSGIYFYQIKANDFVSVKKMILMK